MARAMASGGSSVRANVSARKKSTSESVWPWILGYSDGSTANASSRFMTANWSMKPLCLPEQPAVVTERMAVRLLHRAADRSPDVGDEVTRANVVGDLLEVMVVPRGLDAVEHPGYGVVSAVPPDPEAVAVRRLGTHPRVQALIDEGVGTRLQGLLEQRDLLSMRASGRSDAPFHSQRESQGRRVAG